MTDGDRTGAPRPQFRAVPVPRGTEAAPSAPAVRPAAMAEGAGSSAGFVMVS